MKNYINHGLARYILLALISANFNLKAVLFNINNWSNYTITINCDKPVPQVITLFSNSVLIKKQICGNVTVQAMGGTVTNSKLALSLNCMDPRTLDLTIINDGNGGISASVSFENRAKINNYKKIIELLKQLQNKLSINI